MLSISTVEEALEFLTHATGRRWTQSELFDISANLQLRFRAIVPLDVLAQRWEFLLGTGLVKAPFSMPSYSMLAMVYPTDIAKVWQLGRAIVSRAEHSSAEDGVMNILTSPITVTAAEIRIREAELARIWEAWKDSQSGKNWWSVPRWARPGPVSKSSANTLVLTDSVPSPEPVKIAPWLAVDPRDANLEPFNAWGNAARYTDADGKDLGSFPAMVAKIRYPDGRPASIHRTYLTAAGEKAPVPQVKKIMAGKPLNTGAVRLSAVGPCLGIAEGIETALAASARFGLPVWAATNATLLESWVPPAGVERVLIASDNDASFTGQSAAYGLARRLVKRGIAVEIQIPAEMGRDWADESI